MGVVKWNVCGGLLLALAWGSNVYPAFGQGKCTCKHATQHSCQHATQDACQDAGMYIGSGVIEESPMSEADAILSEIDNPSELINLTVFVQEKAIVFINGEPTFTKGTSRPYIVRGLKAGKTYMFRIEGVLKNETGAEYAAEKTVTLKAGDSQEVVLHLRRRNRPIPPVLPPFFDPRAVAPFAAAPK